MQTVLLRLILFLSIMTMTACDRGHEDHDNEDESSVTITIPYGSWPSPVSAESGVAGSRALGSLSFDQGFLYWVESRPEEGGRNTIMRWSASDGLKEILPAPWNARTRVQEYGGRSVLVVDGTIWFSNFDDQRIYRFSPGDQPVPITPEQGLRYAGCVFDGTRNRLICVREDHRVLGEPRNVLVALPLGEVSEGEVLFEDADFVSAVNISSDGKRIAFTSWLHPNMPWDNTTLWSAGFDSDGGLAELTEHNPNSGESVINPQFANDHQLYAISDRDDWWKIYRVEGQQNYPFTI